MTILLFNITSGFPNQMVSKSSDSYVAEKKKVTLFNERRKPQNMLEQTINGIGLNNKRRTILDVRRLGSLEPQVVRVGRWGGVGWGE